MANKYLSIITNFGCHFKCPYCIVKNNSIDVPATTIDSLSKLEEAVTKERANMISVSGGGDPLHEYSLHKDYYDKLFAICQKINIPLEMHTSYIGSDFPYERCYRVVYHCHSLGQLSTIRKHGNEIVRVVFVVTEDFTDEKIDKISDFVYKSAVIDELSFRQMVDDNYNSTDYCHDYLMAGHKAYGRWWYIEQDDYNSYFVNGKIYYRFKDISDGVKTNGK